MKVCVLIPFLICSSAIAAEVAGQPGDAIVQQFCAASRGQDRLAQAASMDVEIAASLPKLNKKGKLTARRKVSASGRVSYEKLRFEGDGTIKNQIINRYLSTEAEVHEDPSLSVPLTPENYHFKFKAKIKFEGRDTYWFDVSPKHKRAGVFRGQLWVDAATFLRVQESGYLVKSPSIFLKKVAFVRKYQIRGGISIPTQEQSTVDTRLGIGTAEMTIDFSNFAIDGEAEMQ